MKDTPAGNPLDSGWYAIRANGHLASRWTTRFDGMSLTTQDDGTTVLEGPVPDQAALHGLLRALGDLGLPLISVTPARPDPPTFLPAAPGTSQQGD